MPRRDFMDGRKTPLNEIVKCSRCGNAANPDDGWQHNWPLYGRIEIGFAVHASAFLAGAKNEKGARRFIEVRMSWPPIQEAEAQRVVIEWGNGYKYNSTGKYRLCYDCQKHLLHVVGKFFGVPKEAKQRRAWMKSAVVIHTCNETHEDTRVIVSAQDFKAEPE